MRKHTKSKGELVRETVHGNDPDVRFSKDVNASQKKNKALWDKNK